MACFLFVMGKAFGKDYLDSFIGKKKHKLTILEHFKKGKNNVNYFLCLCECGRISEIRASHIFNDGQQTCGRHHKKYANPKEGYSIYSVWNGMKNRCHNPKNQKYYSYGARGIKVCNEWKNNYGAFYKWAIESGYKEGLWIERIDNDGDYCPENCKWATRKEQMRNTRRNKFIEYKSETKTLVEWCESLNLYYGTINSRLSKGWSIERAFETPTKRGFEGTR